VPVWRGGVSVSSRRALSLLLLDPDQVQLLFALLVVRGQTLVLLQQLLVLLHQPGRVLLVLLVLVQFGDELLPAHTHTLSELNVSYNRALYSTTKSK